MLVTSSLLATGLHQGFNSQFMQVCDMMCHMVIICVASFVRSFRLCQARGDQCAWVLQNHWYCRCCAGRDASAHEIIRLLSGLDMWTCLRFPFLISDWQVQAHEYAISSFDCTGIPWFALILSGESMFSVGAPRFRGSFEQRNRCQRPMADGATGYQKANQREEGQLEAWQQGTSLILLRPVMQVVARSKIGQGLSISVLQCLFHWQIGGRQLAGCWKYHRPISLSGRNTLIFQARALRQTMTNHIQSYSILTIASRI